MSKQLDLPFGYKTKQNKKTDGKTKYLGRNVWNVHLEIENLYKFTTHQKRLTVLEEQSNVVVVVEYMYVSRK